VADLTSTRSFFLIKRFFVDEGFSPDEAFTRPHGFDEDGRKYPDLHTLNE
jgi:hypothetical protein